MRRSCAITITRLSRDIDAATSARGISLSHAHEFAWGLKPPISQMLLNMGEYSMVKQWAHWVLI